MEHSENPGLTDGIAKDIEKKQEQERLDRDKQYYEGLNSPMYDSNLEQIKIEQNRKKNE